MNINWSTVFFQIINFWIIVWILKKYLFKPVLSSMDKREKAIQSRLKEAENAKNKAEKEKQNLLNKIASLEQSKASILAEAYKKADAEYAIMLKSFNAEMAGKRKAFEEQVVLEREFLRNSIKDLAGETILKTLADALQNLANTNVEKAILENFVLKLKSKSVEKLSELKKYYEKNKSLSIFTSFDLDTKTKQIISKTISEIIDEKSLKINFEKHQDIICGLEIVCPPLLISYGVNTYISEFKKNLDNGLAELTKTAKTVEDKK
ncbi:MAG: F0F1 ATP synthase subunit delta [Alphaproteobacteria bacterium]|nr:F0F1 ATP synthase subunit delta [Alphaproteobacteria bacterium]